MKTVFITITRGFIVRNILRSGVLEHLLNSSYKVVIFVPLPKGKTEIPAYLTSEFTGPNLSIVGVPENVPRGYSLFGRVGSFLLNTHSSRAYSQIGNDKKIGRNKYIKYIDWTVIAILSNIPFLKSFIRWIEGHFFLPKSYRTYFETYTPSVVFSTSVISKFDIFFMKEARRRGIPTVSMVKGWDNISKSLYRFVPDLFLVQNERMKKTAHELQGIPLEKIVVTGFPQFDWYKRPEILLSREEFMRSIGLDPTHKLIMHGSVGSWGPQEHIFINDVISCIETPGALPYESSLVIRPHFSNLGTHPLSVYGSNPRIHVDSAMSYSDFFIDHWDPDMENIRYFTNLIFHCDVLINFTSTLTLDAACADRPIINPQYGALIDPNSGEDITQLFYTTSHYRWVLETGAVTVVKNKEELLEALKEGLLQPEKKRSQRERLVRELCFKADGLSSKRIADAVIALAEKKA